MTSAINRTNGELFELPEVFHQVKAVHETAAAAVDIASSAMTAVDTLTGKVSDSVKNVFGALGFVGGAGAIFTIPSLINNISKAIRASSLVERVKSAFRALLDGGALWNAANGILGGLQSVGVIAAKAISWTSIVNIALFPLQAISIALDTHQLVELREERNKLLSYIRPHGLAKYTISDLTRACKHVADNHESLRETLNLSEAADLGRRAQSLYDRLISSQEQVTTKDDAIAFMKILRRRIHTKYNLEVAGLSAKVAGVVVAGVSLFVPPNPITWGIAGVFGIASLAIAGLGKLLLNDDPFSGPRDVWYSKLAHKIREGFGAMTDAAERLSLKVHEVASNMWKKHLPAS